MKYAGFISTNLSELDGLRFAHYTPKCHLVSV